MVDKVEKAITARFFSTRQSLVAGLCAIILTMLFIAHSGPVPASETPHHRVIISTDIGGTDPDDFQSMVHLLLYADTIEIEGLISSPFGPGRKQDILNVIEYYEQDFPNLSTYSAKYPTPDALRTITKQGAISVAPHQGYSLPTEGSNWIIKAARKNDPRPLHILVWGGIEDLAQALHDAPDILPKLRVYFIGGPNKKWSPDAYQYIAENHKNLWIIENNATYRGWFEGGVQTGDWGNKSFVAKHIANQGAMGQFFVTQLGGTIKMGDTPAVTWALSETPSNPSKPGWGGRFVKAWTRPHKVFNRPTTVDDTIDTFGIFELTLPVSETSDNIQARMKVENQSLSGFADGQGSIRFRFSPKSAKKYSYSIESNDPALNGIAGALTATPTPATASAHPDPSTPNWWTDDPAPKFAQGNHIGAKTVNRWRKNFLTDFSNRMKRCNAPANPEKD